VLGDDEAGKALIEVAFSYEEEARRNIDRSETQVWAEQLGSLADRDPG
jgi:hypothetical protein